MRKKEHVTSGHIFHYTAWETELTGVEKVEKNIRSRSKEQLMGIVVRNLPERGLHSWLWGPRANLVLRFPGVWGADLPQTL